MDENEKKEPETAQEPPKPENYSRYMGTLNRIYRRNNNPQRKKLGDGITSLKKGQQPAAPAPEPGKKDRSFLVVAGGAIVLMIILYVALIVAFTTAVFRQRRASGSPTPRHGLPKSPEMAMCRMNAPCAAGWDRSGNRCTRIPEGRPRGRPARRRLNDQALFRD